MTPGEAGAGLPSEEEQAAQRARLQEVDVEIEKRVFGRTTYQYRQTPYLTLADHHDGQGAIYKIPGYSKDIQAAIQILDAWDGDCDLRRQNGQWRVELFKPSMQWSVWAATLPLAICRAALKVFE